MKVKVGSREVSLETRIGGGGEGDVYTSSQGGVAYKIYKPTKRTKEKQQKIQAMVNARLHAATKVVAFPMEIVTDTSGNFLGFSMALVKGGKPLHELYSPKSRRDEFPAADYRFLIRVAGNMARAIGAIHEANCVIGDINHSGILVAQDATVTLIDADSFQLSQGGRTFPCEVGVADFTPPELQGRDLGSVLRKLEHDHFGLAVAIFQLLMMRHPYAGIYPNGIHGIAQAIKGNVFCYSKTRASQTKASPAPGGMTLDDLPSQIAYAFEDSFGLNPPKRPAAKIWIQLLGEYEKNLSKCHQSKTHFYSSHIKKCCWCRIEGQTSLDLFPEILIEVIGRGRSASAHTDIRKIIQACNAIKLPKLENLFPNIPTSGLKPSPLVAQAKSSQTSKKIFGAIVIGGAILGAIALPQIFIFALFAGGFGYSLMTSDPDTSAIVSSFNSAKNALDKSWQAALNGLGLTETYRVIDDLKELIENYQELDALEQKEIKHIQQNKHLYQLNDFLSKRYIKNFKISGIGISKTAELASWGIETAADIEKSKITRIPGFGDKTADLLISWRKKIERDYKPQPFNNADQQAITQVKLKYDQLKSDYEKKISASYQSTSRSITMLSNLDAKIATNTSLKKAISFYAHALVDVQAAGISLNRQLNRFDPLDAIKKITPSPKASSQSRSTNSSTTSTVFTGTSHTTSNQTPTQPATNSSGNPTCPNCGSSMVKRLAKRGRNAGNYFWGCSRYPRCKGTRSI